VVHLVILVDKKKKKLDLFNKGMSILQRQYKYLIQIHFFVMKLVFKVLNILWEQVKKSQVV
jgi:hypothetical protein